MEGNIVRSIPKIGDVFLLNDGGVATVIEYKNKNNVTIRFEDGNTLVTRSSQLRSGSVKNPFKPERFGKGYIGVGRYLAKIDGKNLKAYDAWTNMLRRCYATDNNGQITYKGVIVCEEWHNYQNFAEWYYSQPESDYDGWAVDKDLTKKGNKVYCPSMCALVPKEVNTFLTLRQNHRGDLPLGVYPQPSGCGYGAHISKGNARIYLGTRATPEKAFYELYKPAKEEHAKALAEKWKGVISEKIYKALCNYTVDITD